MAVISDPVRRHLEKFPAGVVAVIRPNGRPHQTVAYYAVDGDAILISTESKRLKARAASETGWASICVVGSAKPYPAATLEGPATIVTERIGPITAAIVGRVTESDPPAPQSDEELAAVDRVILRIDVERVYSATYLEET